MPSTRRYAIPYNERQWKNVDIFEFLMQLLCTFSQEKLEEGSLFFRNTIPIFFVCLPSSYLGLEFLLVVEISRLTPITG